ncbi:MAG: methyltransferase domain-containing protein [Acidimicrobiia bacterium]|nr:methyltransferase domain-containing protein [Acidimicrobiia bacterium]
MSSTGAPTQGPSPALFFETVNSYQRTAALKAAIELEVFTAIGADASTAEAIAGQVGGTVRATRILCDYLVVIGLLLKNGDRYELTGDSALFLDKKSPAYMGGAALFLLSPTVLEAFGDLARVVRTGKTVLDGQGTVEPDHPVWREFARSMAPMMALPADLIASRLAAQDKPQKILDIAAGHGLFGIAFAKKNPQAFIHALDWPKVLEVARQNAGAAGISNRYSTMEGDAFQVEFGNGYDVVLLTNFLHHFDFETCVGILRKIHGSLNPGGVCATLEFVPNEDRVTPAVPAAFAMMMLGTTAKGDAYTFAELDSMASQAGFARSEWAGLDPSPQSVVVSYKA